MSFSVPIYELWRQATGSDAAATVFLVVLLTINLFVVNAIQQTSSHLIWAFGRDNGLVFSKQLAQMHPGLEVPVWSLLANAAVIFVCGCIYLASTAAFNALINTTIILQMISFAMPCMLLMFRGRSKRFLAKDRWFRLPGWLGWACNATVVVFAIIEVVFFDLPTSVPTTGSSMSESFSCSFICESPLRLLTMMPQIILAQCWPQWRCSALSTGSSMQENTIKARVLNWRRKLVVNDM